MLDVGLKFINHYAQLPKHFYSKLPIKETKHSPSLIHANLTASELIGLNHQYFDNPEFIKALSGKALLMGSEPLATVYSGHQFGIWAGQLGDGRAMLLGQIKHNHARWDLQLKGSGRTPYSRMGNGLSTMHSSIREYLCAEAMHTLGIPTTRSLCLIASHDAVLSQGKKESGAIVARLAETHIRFGHFEHFYYNHLWEDLKLLADHTIDLYFTTQENPNLTYEQWFAEIVKRTAQTIAKWMAVGFCHGVMNTDNMSITGLTIDYGPYGFLEKFNPSHICNQSDENGRYAYNQQPAVALWNLQTLAHALQPILPLQQSQPILEEYAKIFEQHYDWLMTKKLGFNKTNSQANALWNDLLTLMRQTQADYSMVFNHLPNALVNPKAWYTLFGNLEVHQSFARQWLMEFKQAHHLKDKNHYSHQRMTLQNKLTQINPTYVLRNWVAESAIQSMQEKKHPIGINEVLYCLQTPFKLKKNTLYPYEKLAPSQFKNILPICSS